LREAERGVDAKRTAGVDVNRPSGKNASADFAKKSISSHTVVYNTFKIQRHLAWPKRATRFALLL
jgi:hypothetical protein